MLQRFWAILWSRWLEFVRDKSALIWSFIFPVCLVGGFAVMFSGDGRPLYKVGLLGEGQPSEFVQTKHIQFVDYQDSDKAMLKLRQHGVDLLVDSSQNTYWVNESSANSYIVERLFLQVEEGFAREVASGRKIRYVDWVVPGILGMNMMFSCLFGVGYVIVRYRKLSVLKRFKATPLSAFEFIMAQVISRLVIVMVVISIVYSLCNWLFDFYMIGSYWNLAVITMLGALSLISLALIIASRSDSEELTNGLLNLVTFPMIILSGVWFSLEGAPQWVQDMALWLPLTHMIEGARAIMGNGDGLWDIRHHVFSLLGMTALYTAIAASLFRWEGQGR